MERVGLPWNGASFSIDRPAALHGRCLLGNRICAEANAQGSELEHCIFGYGRIDSVHNRLIGWSVENIIQGILAGAFAVFGHQAVKQTAEAIATRKK